jgi:NhaP-type Na+/H+ or K+/H+ antiporter
VPWEGPIFLITLALILAFPTGRLDGPAERAILALAVLGVVVPIVVVSPLAPQIAATISRLQRRLPGDCAARRAAPRPGRLL